MAQPTYPHNIVKPYVFWLERGKIAIAYHNLDDGNGGKNGEFISPLAGYDAKLVANTISFVGGSGEGALGDANEKFLEAGFEVGQDVTISGSATAVNNATGTITLVTKSSMVIEGGTSNNIVNADAGDTVTIRSGTPIVVRIYASKKAEVLDRSANELTADGKFLVTNLEDEPEFPEQFHDCLVDYAVYKGFELIPTGESLQVAQYWWGKYFEKVRKAKAFADGGQVYGIRKVAVNGTQGII